MNLFQQQPEGQPSGAIGLLRAAHFQIAYATNDIDRACALFAEKFGISNFTRLEGPLAAGGHIRVELAWVGPVMYELITAEGAGSDIYVGRLPQVGFAVRHHHLGYLVSDSAEWDALLAEAQRVGADVPWISHNAGFMKSCFIDAPLLGHYLEYICPEAAGTAFFASVARN